MARVTRLRRGSPPIRLKRGTSGFVESSLKRNEVRNRSGEDRKLQMAIVEIGETFVEPVAGKDRDLHLRPLER